MKYISEVTIRRLIKFNGSCCNSCHDDEEIGISMCYIDFDKNREAEVCCSVYNAYKKWLKKSLKTLD